MKIFNTKTDDKKIIESALSANINTEDDKIFGIVKGIIKDVKEGGDATLLSLGQKFDSPALTSLKVSEEEIEEAKTLVDESLLTALKQSKDNIYNFHKHQIQHSKIPFDEFVFSLY